MRQSNVGEAIERAFDFFKSKDRNVVLKPEQRQAMSSQQKGEDVLAVLPTVFGKIHDFYSLRNCKEGERPFIVCVVNFPFEKHSFGPEDLCTAVELTAENVSRVLEEPAEFIYSSAEQVLEEYV